MTLQYSVLPWRWEGISAAGHRRLGQILDSWKGTPYCAGARVKGKQGGVDCVRFVCAVLDEFLERPQSPLESLPPDSAMHNREGAIGVVKRIVRLYEPVQVIEDRTVRPGDVGVVGHPMGGPGHAMIAGVVRNTLWQSSAGCVHFTGLGLVPVQQKVFRVYRIEEITAKWSSS
jgi:hypothetical protein